jgi:hypothetical protein
MGERIKTILAIVGLVGIVAAGFMIYDRFWQHPRPNVPRFESEIASRDESSERFFDFLTKTQGKIIYFAVTLQERGAPDDITIGPAIPRKGQQFEFTFLKDCLKPPPARRDPVTNPCTDVSIRIDEAQGVETQVFNPVGAFIQVKGYFFNVAFESHMNAQGFTLHPVSAEQIMSK